MAERAVTPELGDALREAVAKAARYYATLGYGSFAPGNADGGLSTVEEKSMGAYAKSGHSRIAGLIKPGDIPPRGGLYPMDVVPDGEVRFGFPNISDNAEIVELIASGCHLVLFVTGRGSSWAPPSRPSSRFAPIPTSTGGWRMTWISTRAASWKDVPRSTKWGTRSWR
ncbi:MAG: hydrolase [Roseomonas sp.]|nr:hydrolase [Roseomonas sp.]